MLFTNNETGEKFEEAKIIPIVGDRVIEGGGLKITGGKYAPKPSPDELKAASEALNNAPVPTGDRVVGFLVEEELDKLLNELWNMAYSHHSSHKQEVRVPETLSAINSLTLKQVMSLIGEDDQWSNDNSLTRNELRAELRQSAERIYGGKK